MPGGHDHAAAETLEHAEDDDLGGGPGEPDSAEPTTNRAIEDMYRRLVPKRSAIQPLSGITVASASV